MLQIQLLLLQRYRDIFGKLYREDRDLTIRRDGWGFALGLIIFTNMFLLPVLPVFRYEVAF